MTLIPAASEVPANEVSLILMKFTEAKLTELPQSAKCDAKQLIKLMTWWKFRGGKITLGQR